MLIGAGVALILNLYMPSIEGKIKEDQKYIDDAIRTILLSMADALKKNYVSIKEEDLFQALEKRLEEARKRSYRNLNNYIFVETNYYVEYMEMRTQQFHVLNRLREHFRRFFMTYEQTIMVSDFTAEVGDPFKRIHSKGLLADLLHLKKALEQ